MENEKLKDFCQQMIAYRLPRWEDLPTFDIYMDQLITLVKQYLKDLFDEEDVIITSSMINNYVKMELIPKPVKKRYNREHIAYLAGHYVDETGADDLSGEGRHRLSDRAAGTERAPSICSAMSRRMPCR